MYTNIYHILGAIYPESPDNKDERFQDLLKYLHDSNYIVVKMSDENGYYITEQMTEVEYEESCRMCSADHVDSEGSCN